MNIATTNTYTTTSKTMWFLKASVITVAFLLSIITSPLLFAQEKVESKQVLSETKVKEVSTDEKSLSEIKEEVLIEETKPIETELSNKQLKELSQLEGLLKAEKITQEEYDKRKEEIIGVKPIEPEALFAKSAQVEPEAQTLGKYIAPSVSTSNGSLNYSYPIVVPTGRNGLTPDISLNYNSSNKSQSSIIGTGWSLNIPYIQRVNKTGTDKLYTDNYFTSSLDGELISQGDGIYTPRTENGSFLKYEYSNDAWTVTDKQGTEYQFGTTAQARQDNSADTTQIFSWMLETVTDTNGNTISYSYFKDEGQIYPDTISYNQSGLFDISFNRVARPIPNTAYTSVFVVETAYTVNQIEVSTSNNVTATYDISLTDNFIKDITVTGFEGVSSFELPSLEMEYSSEGISGNFQYDSNWFTKTNNAYQRCSGTGKSLVDINGDSLADCIHWPTSSYSGVIKINTGTTWVEDSSYSFPPTGRYCANVQSGIYGSLADINGDGLPDCISESNTSTYNKIYLNNGQGWNQTPESTIIPNNQNPNFFFSRYGSFADVNGDGLADAVINTGNYSSQNKVYLNTGTSFQYDSNWFTKTNNAYQRCSGTGKSLVDINGDSLVDCIHWPTSNYAGVVKINTGSTWIEDSSYVLPPYYIGCYSGYNSTGSLADINGDGLPDCISESSYYLYNGVFLNNGHGWNTTKEVSYTVPNNGNSYKFFSTYGSFTDVNGDGLADAVINTGNYSSQNKVYLNTGTGFANLSKLTNSQNGESEFTYTHARIQDISNEAPFPIKVVESITTNDKNGNVATTSYEYRDADYYYNTATDKKFAGFGSVIKTTDDGTKTTTKYHQANGETGNEPTDSYAKIGKVYEQRIQNSTNDLFTRNRTNYTETALGNNAFSIQSESQLSQQYDGTSGSTDTATSYIYDAFGNATQQIQYGIVNGNINGTFTDTGNDKRTTDSTYTSNTTDYIVGLPTNQTLKDNNGTKSAETNFSYDADGNLLTQSNWITGSDYSDTTYTYNNYGLPLTETDALSNTTTYSYDAENMHPATVTNAKNQTTSYTYDYSSGKVTQITDANGKVTQYEYDGLDRLLSIAGTIGNAGTQTLKDIVYNTTANPQYTKTTSYTGSDSQNTYSYTDGFGKTIQTKLEMDSGWLTLDTVYDEMGRTEKQSLPYQTSSSNNSNPTLNNDLMTTFSYDTLGRVLSTTNAKGTTSTSYDGFETTITDALSNTKDLITDAFGNLLTVKEYNNSSIYTTDYDYNAQNLLTKITDAENNVRNIAYDGLGRRTSLEDLHTQSDSIFGTWNFTYNDINLVSQSDPQGTTTSYSYDNLNRVLTENNSSTTGTDITYSYDSCTNGLGNVCAITTPDITTNYTYLKQGLVDTESKIIDAVTYTTDNDYDRAGKATKVTHPNASYTEYEYNTRGLVDNVKYNGTSLVTAQYGVHGRPESLTHSNGVTSTFTYDNTELYELTNKTTTNGIIDLQDLSYSYDNVGNITGIVDSSDTDTAKTQTFTYDDLYRLTSTNVTNSANTSDYSRNYSYSPIGNITAFDGVTYSYTDTGYSNPHAVTNIAGTNYSYDNNGNLNNDGTWTYTWNYNNTLASSTDGTNTSSYEYDSSNQRIKLVEGSDTTIYPTSDYEMKNGNVKVSLNLGDSLVATDDNGTISHISTDHLGGTNITTDNTGNITQTLDYYPFGDTRIDNGTDNETKQFTGYIKDASTGLNYAGARYYAGKTGRFISQDPAVTRIGTDKKEQKQLLGDPQQLNTYSYVRNNPIYFKDPEGEILPAIILGAAVGSAFFLSDVNYVGDNAPTQTTEIIDKAVYNNITKGGYDELSIGKQAGFGLLIGIGSLNPKKVGSDLVDVGKAGFKAFKNINISGSQLQKKFKHAKDFGISGGYNLENLNKFKSSILEHINNKSTLYIKDELRGKPVNSYFNPKTNLKVIEDTKGNFISAWKLNKKQIKRIKKKK